MGVSFHDEICNKKKNKTTALRNLHPPGSTIWLTSTCHLSERISVSSNVRTRMGITRTIRVENTTSQH